MRPTRGVGPRRAVCGPGADGGPGAAEEGDEPEEGDVGDWDRDCEAALAGLARALLAAGDAAGARSAGDALDAVRQAMGQVRVPGGGGM